MSDRRASDVFVECLEAEGVKYVFGIPGEETLDLNESLAASSVAFVPVRHEQGGAYMADMYGRLTGRAGVCLGTLGPGATNLITAVADAFLDRAPLVALTGQADLERMHKESHQYIDIVEMMRPITKWNARVGSPRDHPRGRPQGVQGRREREAGRHPPRAARGRHGRAARRGAAAAPPAGDARARRARAARGSRPHPPRRSTRSRSSATASSARAPRPALREFARATGISVAETFMGKGAIDYTDPRALGTVGLQSRDYAMAGFEDADVVIAIGYDLVEHAPEHWNPKRDKKIVMVDSQPAEIDEHFLPEVELIGDIYHVLSRLGEECRDVPHSGGSSRLRDVVLGRLEAARTDDALPDAAAARAVGDPRRAGPATTCSSPTSGLHKLWIGRMFPAHEPNTVLIANGLAGHGLRPAVRDRRQARASRPPAS